MELENSGNQNRYKFVKDERRSYYLLDAQTNKENILQYFGLVFDAKHLNAVKGLVNQIDEHGGPSECRVREFAEDEALEAWTMVWTVPLARRSEAVPVAFANESFDLANDRVVVQQQSHSFQIDETYWR